MILSILGVGLALGIILIARGLTHQAPKAPGRRRTKIPAREISPRDLTRLTVGLVIGIVLAMAGWLVFLVIAPAAAYYLPKLVATTTQTSADRVEAVADWTGNLNSLITTSGGVATAIISSQNTTPAAIRPEVDRLVARLRAGVDFPAAMYRFAEEVGDQSADFVAAALILNRSAKGAGLRAALQSLADDARAEVRMRREVETERARSVYQARVVSILIAVMALALVIITPVGEWYRTPTGEVTLALITAAMGGCLAWVRARAMSQSVTRFLVTPASRVTAGGAQW